MENPKTHKHHPLPAGQPQLYSPRLLRSKSVTPANPLPENSTYSTRSKSTAKSRTLITNKLVPDDHQHSPAKLTCSKNKPSSSDDHHRDRNKDASSARVFQRRMAPASPSAWALSPGRSTALPPASPISKSPSSLARNIIGGSKGGGMRGVLKYFKQKKKVVVSTEETDYQWFRIMHNRLFQWRFTNARAESSMASVKIVTEKKIFNVWVKILALRNSNMGKKIEIQKYKHEIKQYQIINPQLRLLTIWSRLEARNSEAVFRLSRKLTAASIKLPLIHDSKADVVTVCNAMNTATTIMEGIEATISKFYSQVEKSCYLLTELTIIVKQEIEYLEELEKWILIVASLKEKEKSLRAHLIEVTGS